MEIETASGNNLDMSRSQRGVWLVKVPKYISNRWNKCPGDVDAGHLKITKVPGQKAQISLTLSEAVLGLNDVDDTEDIPREHILNGSAIHEQTLAVFSEQTSTSPQSAITTEELGLEGKVTQRLECKPRIDNKYMKLKQNSMIKASTPRRTTIQVSGIIQSYKPVADHKHNIEYEEKKKFEGKNFRETEEKVCDMLFAAFEKHEYYNIKDLVKITKQPVSYLKEILKKICVYTMKDPHRNTWKLKPEYYYAGNWNQLYSLIVFNLNVCHTFVIFALLLCLLVLLFIHDWKNTRNKNEERFDSSFEILLL